VRLKRHTHSPEYKSKEALAAIKGGLTMVELVKMYDGHANQITRCKKQLLDGATVTFGKSAKKTEDTAATVLQLHDKIGKFTMENAFLQSRLEGIYGPRGNKW
jgi:transposase